MPVIRKIRKKDIPAAARMFVELHSEHVNHMPECYKPINQGIAEKYVSDSLGSYSYIGIYNEDQLLGYAAYYLSTIRHDPLRFDARYLTVLELFVDEEHRRKGYATQLMNYMEKQAVSKKCTGMSLYVLPFNKDAIFFYHILGYEIECNMMAKQLGAPI